VALHLTRLHGAPPLLAIRPIYLRKLERHLGREDYLERKLLHHYVSGRASRLSPRRAAELMATRGVTTLLVPRDRPEVHLLRRELAARGFRIVPTRGHLLATAGGRTTTEIERIPPRGALTCPGTGRIKGG
jgi:hypothetical protein